MGLLYLLGIILVVLGALAVVASYFSREAPLRLRSGGWAAVGLGVVLLVVAVLLDEADATRAAAQALDQARSSWSWRWSRA